MGRMTATVHDSAQAPAYARLSEGSEAPDFTLPAIVPVVPELLRTLVFARPCGGDQFAAGTVSPSLDMSR